jgi:hypothetical protein
MIERLSRRFLQVISGLILLILFMPETSNLFDWFVAAMALYYFVWATAGGMNDD